LPLERQSSRNSVRRHVEAMRSTAAPSLCGLVFPARPLASCFLLLETKRSRKIYHAWPSHISAVYCRSTVGVTSVLEEFLALLSSSCVNSYVDASILGEKFRKLSSESRQRVENVVVGNSSYARFETE